MENAGPIIPLPMLLARRPRVYYSRLIMSDPRTEVTPMPEPEARDPFLQAALDEAKKGLDEGGIPIGSVLVIDGTIVGRGHNRRVQRGSAILHAEMDAIEDAGRLKASDYRRGVLYST